jgi:hypothetical protein
MDVSVDRIAVVNGLRGMAIIGVLFQHIGLGWAMSVVGNDFGMLRPLLSNGWTGVNLFFIRSGFVLFLPYAAQRRTMVARADFWHFYRGRFLRLMPLYFFSAVVLLVLAGPVLGSEAFDELAIDLATVRFVLRPHYFGVAINFPLWTIGVEILFSVAFPFVVIAIARIGLVPTLLAALLAALTDRIGGRLWDPHPLGPNFISDNIFGRIDEFVIGMALARWHVEGRIPSWARSGGAWYRARPRGVGGFLPMPVPWLSIGRDGVPEQRTGPWLRLCAGRGAYPEGQRQPLADVRSAAGYRHDVLQPVYLACTRHGCFACMAGRDYHAIGTDCAVSLQLSVHRVRPRHGLAQVVSVAARFRVHSARANPGEVRPEA